MWQTEERRARQSKGIYGKFFTCRVRYYRIRLCAGHYTVTAYGKDIGAYDTCMNGANKNSRRAFIKIIILNLRCCSSIRNLAIP